MCGIYGYQVKEGEELTPYETTLIALTLARDMESRGRDSFGAVSVNEGRANTIRGLGRVSETGSKLFKLAAQSRTFLGHTRQATVGAVTLENSHPFKIKNIIGVHNGSIRNYSDLNKRYSRNFQVDSQQIFAHLADNLPLKEVEGYGTFFWLDGKEQWSRIYFGKTTGGSLTVAKLHRNKAAKLNDTDQFMLVWASEWNTVKKIADLLDVAWYPVTIEAEKIHFIENAGVFVTADDFKLGTPSFTPARSNANAKISDYHYHFEDADGEWDHQRGIWVARRANDDGPTSSNMSRKERKALKRLQQKWKKDNGDESKWLDPTAENIMSGTTVLPRVFTGQGGTEVHNLCPKCNCYLEKHLWTWCEDNKWPRCKAKATEGCETSIPICNDCGHYLVDTIHEAEPAFGMVTCKVCENICAPEATTVEELEARFKEAMEDEEIAARGDSEAITEEIPLVTGMQNLIQQLQDDDGETSTVTL